MTADDKYFPLNRDNLTETIPTQLSQKRKASFRFFLAFSKSTLNFEHLQKKDDLHSWNIFYITHYEKGG